MSLRISRERLERLGLQAKHFGLEEADDDIHRLAFEISGMGIMLHVRLEVIQVIRPQLLETAKALDCYHERLLSYAMALVALEESRRNTFQR
jgi:TetR/AcrR family transcriptional regulator, regulator of cefoperazone and chloramphenicol sensitivity